MFKTYEFEVVRGKTGGEGDVNGRNSKGNWTKSVIVDSEVGPTYFLVEEEGKESRQRVYG